ncbi:MAG: FAD-dependent oxidoreductase [Chthoniobacteraceae bacterium]|nr:FAD-dependent oxidoreductase [Chthoniobacteraceae bacterium]
MQYTEVSYDLVVAGGGVGGVITAITASRKGLRVALVDNKPGLGGNACSEIGVTIDGAVCFGLFPNMREGGPVEELKEQLVKMDPFFRNTQGSSVMLFWCEAEKVTVYSELNLHAVDTEGRRVTAVYGSQSGTERNYKFFADQFVDATGDGTIAALAGCESRTGREAKSEFGELLAPDKPDNGIMGASVLFRASEKKVPTQFERPSWAYEYTNEDDLPYRLSMQKGPVDEGFWWVEYAGDNNDPIGDYESIRKELLKCTYGVWSFLKNDPSRAMEYYSLDNVSISPAKRESRRIVGDYIVCERDIVERTPFPDAVAYAGWNIDIHVPGGFKSKLKPNVHAHFPWVFNVPLRSLYAKDTDNLWLVGRDISVSHVALGATRLQATIGTMGHAVAIAAALAHRNSKTAREIARDRYKDVQQEILKDGSFIPGVKNTDEKDHALSAEIAATSEQVLAFERSSEYMPVGKGMALSFPVTEGRVERMVLPLRNSGQAPVEVKLYFAPSAHPNDFSHRKALTEKSVVLNPGAHDISWELSLPPLAPGLYSVLMITAGEVDWLRSNVEPYGCFTGKYDPDFYFNLTPETKEDLYLVLKPIMVAAGFEPVEWVRPRNHRLLQLNRLPNRTNLPLPFAEISPVQRPYAAANVASGVSHSDILPDLWISDPSGKMPQELLLLWKEARNISSVRIVFDTDLDMNHPAVRPIDYLVKRYSLAVRKGGAWKTVASCDDNRQRFKIHEFEPCVADALKLVVEEIHDGGKSARVFEIRAY